MSAFARSPIDVAYIRGRGEADALRAATSIIEAGAYERYLIVADDVIITSSAITAVVTASAANPRSLATGYCNLDLQDSRVNLTRRALTGDTPHPDAYDFYERDELPARGMIASKFAGLALTCITRELAPLLLPLGWYGTGWASDFHLSKKCERAGIEIAAPVDGFVWHVKERWNHPDQDPTKRLRVGHPELFFQQEGITFPMTLINTQALKGGPPTMSDKIAKKDITKVNELGQNVVLVPAGQPIPDDLDLTGTSAEAKKVAAPTENKSRRAASTKRK